jgi:hypothetical protein
LADFKDLDNIAVVVDCEVTSLRDLGRYFSIHGCSDISVVVVVVVTVLTVILSWEEKEDVTRRSQSK